MNFLDKEIEGFLEKDGFVVLDVLSKKEVDILKNLYKANKDKHLVKKENTHSSTDTKNSDFVEFIDKSLEKIIRPRLNTFLSSYDYMLSTFIVKEPGQGNITGFHQDPTLIDEPHKKSANIWIALQDTNKENGCLQFVKGSHKIGNMLVVTPNFPKIFEKFQDKLSYFSVDVPLKAGQGVIFDNKLVHGANSNTSGLERIATVSALKSSGCPWVYYYMDQESKKIEKYNIDYQTYLRYPKGKRPERPILEIFDFDFEQISFTTFLKRLVKSHPVYTFKGIIKYLFRNIQKY